MREEIVAKVLFKGKDDVEVIVRKAVFGEVGRLYKKYGLSATGEWLEIEERCQYPPECLLPVILTRSEEEPVKEEPVKEENRCPKCEGKGFIEYEHGLIMLKCDVCNGTGEAADDKSGDSGDRLDTPDTGSGDTGEPKLTQKPKAKKKTRKAHR